MQKAIFFLALAGTGYALLTAQVPDEKGKPAPEPTVSGSHSSFFESSAEPDDEEPGFDETVIKRDASGQFHLAAAVDGQETEFLIDTGADVVALTVDEAQRLGLSIDPNSFRPISKTASGTGNGAVVRLATLEVAGAELRNVDALVMEGLGTNLLGQNALSQLGEVRLEGNRMVIRR